MLDQEFKNQLVSIFEGLQSTYVLKILVPPDHPNKIEFIELLEDVASCSKNIRCEVEKGENLELRIVKNGQQSSFVFKAVPTGHEFSSLLLAILNLEGLGKNIPDSSVIKKIQSFTGNIEIKSYISLTCTNCPDVVQAFNLMSIINPSIHHEIIDGSIYQEEVEQLNIQAVPTVYLNGSLMHIGRATLGELIQKMDENLGSKMGQSKEIINYDVVVAGGGPAGVSAAIYSARKGLKVAIVAERLGGQVTETVGIENLISVPTTTGAVLAENLKTHLLTYSVDLFENRKITQITIDEIGKQISTSLGETLQTQALIIATGANWKKLGIPGESRYIGSGVAFCAHCDGPFYKGKRVAVIGGGNSGLEAAIDLSAIASEVTLFEYLPELKGDEVLQDKLKRIPFSKILTNVQTLLIEGDETKVTALTYKHRNTGVEERLEVDGIFVQIGLQANSELVKNIVETNSIGEILIDEHCRTNIPGIYAAGDVTTVPYKQIVVAMGEGAKASLSAFEDRLKDKLK